MHKVKINDLDQEKKNLEKHLEYKNRKKIKSLKINDDLFEIGLRKGLIEKNENDYYFIGDDFELLAFKKNKSFNSLNS